jgi:hypothetical protein
MLEIRIPNDERVLCLGQTPFRKNPSIGFRVGGCFTHIGSIRPDDLEALEDWLTKLAETGSHRYVEEDDE